MRPEAATLPLVIVGAVIAWWGWKNGAYFDVVFLPGLVVLLALLVALLVFSPWPARLQGPARVALLALLALSAWTLVSGLWSPAADIAISDSQRVFAYAVALGLGIWVTVLLGPRMLLSLTPIAAAGAVVAVATLIALWVGDNVAEFLEEDATIRFPVGYRNAVAAFFGIALWPMLTLAASRDIPQVARGALVGTATLAIELAVLTHSREAAFAIVIGAAAIIALHPARLRIVGYIALAALPAALALPWLLDLYRSEGGVTAGSMPALHTACTAAAATSLLSAGLGYVAARADPRLSPRASKLVGRGLLGLLALGVLAVGFALATTEGGPSGFVDRHLEELTAESPPDSSVQGLRFGLDLGFERDDFWGVALDRFEARPLQGEGAGGFRFAYLLERDSDVQPEDPHSVEMLMASELGVPGLLLFSTFAIGVVMAVMRARRLGPSAAALAAAALAAAGYWLVQASVDWFWHYPAITLPVIFVLGAAAAPALLHPAGPPRRGRRALLAAGAALAALALVPFFLSEHLTNQALREWQSDLPGAYSDLSLAADLNPVSSRPLAAEAVIAENAGESGRALGALSEAKERQPDQWTLYFLEARILEETDPGAASRAIERARELNPFGPELDALEQRLPEGS